MGFHDDLEVHHINNMSRSAKALEKIRKEGASATGVSWTAHVSLREENAWGADGTVAVVGKRKKYVPDGGSAAPTQTVEHDEQTLIFSHLGQERPA